MARILRIERISATQVKIITDGFDPTTSHYLLIKNVFDIYGQVINPSSAAIFGPSLSVINGECINSTTIDLDFSTEVKDSTVIPENFTISNFIPFGNLSFTVLSQTSEKIIVTFDRSVLNEQTLVLPINYNIIENNSFPAISFSVESETSMGIVVTYNNQMNLDTILTDTRNYSLSKESPILGPISFTVESESSTGIIVTFNNDMNLDDILINPLNYTISEA